MTRHSKNNTAGAYFTSAEKGKLDYGTKNQRLGRDSMRLPDSCNICLKTASNPVICDEGHLFCRECILQSILNQKQNISNLKKRSKEEENRYLQELEAKEREQKRKKIEEFEKQILNQISKKSTGSQTSSEFWLPRKTPEAPNKPNFSKNLQVTCPVTDHLISMKCLLPVIWSRNKEGNCICDPCGKELISAAVSGLMLFSKCGHVICKKCMDSLCLKGDEIECVTCCKGHNKGKEILNIKIDGTGFSDKGGSVQVSKYSAPFS